jgi:cytochrome c biogenesis protein CcdA
MGVIASEGGGANTSALVTMILFGFGASVPLIAAGYGGRMFFQRNKGSLISASYYIKKLLGVSLLVLGFLVITGLDRSLEVLLIELSPRWLSDLTVSL